jgi:hypothetical protein
MDLTQQPSCGIGGSALDRLFEDVIEETVGRVGGSPFRTERRPFLHLSQGGEQRAVQFSCVGSFHLGFDNELVAFFPDGAFRGELVESLLDRPGIRAVDPCFELTFHLGRPFIVAVRYVNEKIPR